MVNIFKKISRGANNFFKKVDHGASNFFKKIPGQIEKGANVVKDGLNKGLHEAGNIARKVGNTLEKAAPMIGMAASTLVPGMAPAIMAGMTTATALSKQIKDGAKVGQGMTNQLAQQVTNKSNQVLGQAQQAYNTGKSELQNAMANAKSQLSIH